MFLALLLPFLYLREPVRQRAAAEKELTESVRLGQATFEEFCARCHGPEAEGGMVKRYVTPGVKGAKPTDVQAPNLHEIYSRHPDEDVGRGRLGDDPEGPPADARCRPGASATAGP